MNAPIKTIVYADDDRFFRDAMREILTTHGYHVDTASDGLEALTVIQERKPDCVLLDVILPKLDGGEVCSALRTDPVLRHTVVIVFSSLSPKDYTLFPTLNADAYVAKTALDTAARHVLTALEQCATGRWADPAGALLGYEGFRSRRIVSELLQQRRHLRAMFDVLAPGAIELSPDGRIILANQGACQLFERASKELVGCPLTTLVALTDVQSVHECLAALGNAEPLGPRRIAFRVGPAHLVGDVAVIREERAMTGIIMVLHPHSPTPRTRQPAEGRPGSRSPRQT